MGKRKESRTKPLLHADVDTEKPKDMVVQLILPPAALRAIGLGGKWSGKVDAEITGPMADRMAQIAMMQENQRIKQKYIPPPDIKALVDTWNNHALPPPYEGHTRNRQFSIHSLSVSRHDFDEVTDLIPRAELERLVAVYFTTCSTGANVWDGKDHNYKTLSGWVKALLKARKDDSLCWWEPQPLARAGARPGARAYVRTEDAHPDTTKMVAEAFAQVVLGQDTYGKEDDNWSKFKDVAGRIERIIEAGVGVSRSVLAKAIVRCAQKQAEQFENGTVYPGNLLAKNLWKVVLPQYIADHLPGVTLPSVE